MSRGTPVKVLVLDQEPVHVLDPEAVVDDHGYAMSFRVSGQDGLVYEHTATTENGTWIYKKVS